MCDAAAADERCTKIAEASPVLDTMQVIVREVASKEHENCRTLVHMLAIIKASKQCAGCVTAVRRVL